MKKLLFMCVIAAVAVLTSCEEKIERAQVIDNIYTEKVAVDGGFAYKLVLASGDAFSDVSDQLFSKVEYNEKAKLVLGYNGKTFFAYNLEGQQRGAGNFDKLEISDGLVYMTGNGGKISIYHPVKNSIFGQYSEASVVGDKIFAKGPNGWGLYDFDYHYLQDMVYEKLYIVNQKNEKEYDVLRLRNGEWSLVSSDESVYDEPSVKSAVKLLNKKFKPTEPVGVIDMKF